MCVYLGAIGTSEHTESLFCYVSCKKQLRNIIYVTLSCIRKTIWMRGASGAVGTYAVLWQRIMYRYQRPSSASVPDIGRGYVILRKIL